MARTDSMLSLLEAGARAEGLRHKAIASNIANLETPGYRRVDIRFEEFLEKALDSGRPVNPEELKAELYRPKTTPLKDNGNDVSWEAEVGHMMKNSIRHKTYLRLMSKIYQQMALAMDTKS